MSSSDLSRNELNQAIAEVCRERKSEDSESIIISQNELAGVLEIEFDNEVAPITIRRRGVCDNGYYVKKYPEICDYSQIGDTRIRGLVVKPERFLEEVVS